MAIRSILEALERKVMKANEIPIPASYYFTVSVRPDIGEKSERVIVNINYKN